MVNVCTKMDGNYQDSSDISALLCAYFSHFTVVPVHRYECPPGCLDSPGKVVGTGYYDMVSGYQEQLYIYYIVWFTVL